jgi:hypothetical protein
MSTLAATSEVETDVEAKATASSTRSAFKAVVLVFKFCFANWNKYLSSLRKDRANCYKL